MLTGAEVAAIRARHLVRGRGDPVRDDIVALLAHVRDQAETVRGLEDACRALVDTERALATALAVLLPLARAAVALETSHAALDIALDDDAMAAGDQFAALITRHQAALTAFHRAVAALPDALRTELEADA